MCNRLGLAFGVRVRLRVRVGLGVNKLDVNYNIVSLSVVNLGDPARMESVGHSPSPLT